MTSKPEIPAPVRKNGYAYGLDGFTVNKAHRESHTRLNDLLLPHSLTGKRAQKAAWEDAKRIVDKPWIEAQLKHYGIPFDSKAVISGKQASLIKALSDGLCHTVPEAVKSMEADLRQLFEPKKREYEVKLSEYTGSEATRVKLEFAALSSPTAEAEYSMGMFLKKYFLDEGGKPDKSKTPVPIPLPGHSNRSQVHAAAERVPGLHTASGGHGDDRTVAVGWDRDAVWSAAGQAADKSAVKLQQVEEAEWNKLMQRHQSFVSQARSRHQAAEFSIHQIHGIYVIKCDEMGSYSSGISYNNTMRLRILEGQRQGCVGIFDFGVITGIMLLDESKERLASRVVSLDKTPKYHGDDSGSQTDDSIHTDDSGQTDDSSNELDASRKRKAKSMQASQPRKKKQSKGKGGTVFLQWRGAESGEGEIQLDAANEHVGQLKFSDDDGHEFEGTANSGFIGRKIRFQGYRIQGLRGPATRWWKDYSEAG